MSAQWFPITAGLVAALPSLPGWAGFASFDGPVTDGVPPDRYAMVGYTSEGQSGSYSTEQADDGFQVVERGAVWVELVVRATDTADAGDIDIPGKRASLKAALDGIDEWVRADRRLGGLLSAEGYSTFTCTLAPILHGGSIYLARFALNYFTVT